MCYICHEYTLCRSQNNTPTIVIVCPIEKNEKSEMIFFFVQYI